MTEKGKPTIEGLQKKIEDMKKLVERYRTELEDRVATRPLESAGIIFIAGLILGVLIGTSSSRRK